MNILYTPLQLERLKSREILKWMSSIYEDRILEALDVLGEIVGDRDIPCLSRKSPRRVVVESLILQICSTVVAAYIDDYNMPIDERATTKKLSSAGPIDITVVYSMIDDDLISEDDLVRSAALKRLNQGPVVLHKRSFS